MKKDPSKIKYICLFFLFLGSYLFLPVVAADETWSYGFAYNISQGLTPYRDFNMVVPPLFPVLFSVGLFFYRGILMFHIEQALLLVFISYFLEKLVGKKVYILTLILLIITPMIYNLPSYNTLSFFLTVLLVYCEKEEKSDAWIGFLLGCSLLSKQSIGVFITITSFFLAHIKKKDQKKRLIFLMLPLFLTVLYLISTGSFLAFFDQCFLGMFDFSRNGNINSLNFLLILGIFLLAVVYCIKRQIKNEWLYFLAFYSITIPLFDLTHFLLGLFSLLIIVLANEKIRINNYLILASCLLMIGIPLANWSVTIKRGGKYPNDIVNYQYRYLNKQEYHHIKELQKFQKKYPHQQITILSSSAYIFKLTNNIPINKLDLINVGNWGYHGKEKIIKEIKKQSSKNHWYLVNEEELTYGNQIDKDVLKYVMTHGKKIKKVLYFDVYQLN